MAKTTGKGGMPSKGERIAVAFRLTPDINDRLNAVLKVTRRSISTELTVALEGHLERMEAAIKQSKSTVPTPTRRSAAEEAIFA